jgi:hypothetical protein
VVTVVAVVGLLAAAVVVSREDRGYPDEWDDRVADLVAFVESERGLAFEHPVRVEFLSEAEYSEASRLDEAVLADDDRALLEETAAVLAAFGLVSDDADLFDLSNEINDSGTLAFYDPFTETVIVRGTAMTTMLETTLVHELTHVAQDQAFDLEELFEDAPAGAGEAVRALVEGDAFRVEQAYVASLSPQEQQTYRDDYEGAVGDADADLVDVPEALQALFAAPYALGNPLVALVAADGDNTAVDDAFEAPPASSEHLVDPRAFFAGDPPVEVDEPGIPEGADEVGEPDVLGALALYLVLSQRIDPAAALDATLGWGGDSYAAYRDSDRTCVRLHVAGDTADDTDELATTLGDWVAAGPRGAASVGLEGDVVALESCSGDAAADGTPVAGTGALDALLLVALRSEVAASGVLEGRLGRDEALDLGDCVVDSIPVDTLSAAAEATAPELSTAVDDAIARCVPG